jgi:RimJ/RimL family protein N-acetyltransferase
LNQILLETMHASAAFNFDVTANYTLEDEAVLLRPLIMDDYEHLLSFALQEPELWRFSLTTAAGADHLRQYIEAAVEARVAGREYPFIVFDKKQQKWAGSTRFYDIQPAHHTLQLGYTWYGHVHQGTGLNKHCKFLMLQFAFEQAGMERVEFRADAQNERSIAAMKRIGCTVEGILRSNGQRPDGTRRNSIVLSILKAEWNERVKAALLQQLIS